MARPYTLVKYNPPPCPTKKPLSAFQEVGIIAQLPLSQVISSKVWRTVNPSATRLSLPS